MAVNDSDIWNGPTSADKVIMGMVAGDGTVLDAGGCCLPISNCLGLTARHVLEDAHRNLTGQELQPGGNEGDYIMNLALPEHAGGAMFAVAKVWMLAPFDMAVVYFVPLSKAAQEVDFGAIEMNFVPPKVGTEVWAYGYTKNEAKSGEFWRAESRQSKGIVRQIYDSRRDSHSLNFPCFQISVHVEGQMSGAPLFNAEGQVVGVLVTGFEIEDGGEPVGYAASLWPLLGFQVRANDIPGLEVSEDFYLRHLFERGHLQGKDWEHEFLDRARYEKWPNMAPRPR